MTAQEYREAVQRIRAWIDEGTEEGLCHAEAGLAELRTIYPKRLIYIAAELALMLAKGVDAKSARAFAVFAVQEFHPQEGLDDLFALKACTYPDDAPERHQLMFLSEFYRTGALPQHAFDRLDEMRARVCAGQMDAESLRALSIEYYVTRNTLFSFVLMMAWCSLTGHREDCEDYILYDAGQPCSHPTYSGNYSYLARMLTDGSSYAFLLLADGQNVSDMETLAVALRVLGQQVILLRECDDVRAAESVHAYAQMAVQEAQVVGDRIEVVAGKCCIRDGQIVDGVSAVIRLLARSIEQVPPLIVFAADGRMAELHERTALAGDIQRMSVCLPPPFSYAGAFAWVGGYLGYVSYLYGASAADLLAQPPECDFSIVIPVRNTADTLRYTLQTCLAVDYDGTYEIVVSDNSDEGCTAVRALCEELDDPRIRYYRPPVPLWLDKSFEFAFLHARGEFIFSIGADDGVYPWALTYLRRALTEYPNEPFFSWTRGFYTWPDFAPYERGIIGVPLYDADQPARYMQYGLACDTQHILHHIDEIFYALPLFYINSGFRRSYLTSVLHRTGRMLDGAAQDSYIGAVNFLLNDHAIQLLCPLTVAGMSGHSIGANTILSEEDMMMEAKRLVPPRSLHKNFGEYVMRDHEWRFPYIDTADKIGFYLSIARLCDMDVAAVDVDEEEAFAYFERRIYLTEASFERLYGMLLYAASRCNAELYQKYLRRYQEICVAPKHVAQSLKKFETVDKRGYMAEKEALTLDAERFGCQNVADAVAVTARILNL